MKINAFKFGIACAITASVFWIICSVLVMAMPSMMMSMSGDMVHMRLDDIGWHLTWAGVVKGLVAWFVIVGGAGWLLASIYNRLQ
ncbi:DUF5676 family membrane protein [Photobacterium sp. 53610]|uniref:DUF5676 family membrane protein n=1 Tax=Photobacterium sp. 53610 TaxID=3102789 RepID=UPI002EDAF000